MTDEIERGSGKIGCVVMASGRSLRYGTNKLLEPLGDKAMILHVLDHLKSADQCFASKQPVFSVVVVSGSKEVSDLLSGHGYACITPAGPKKSDTMHAGLRTFGTPQSGYLFMPGDQPLLCPETLTGMAEQFLDHPERPLRLSYGKTAGSPVIFPCAMKERLLSYEGEKGGRALLGPDAFDCFEASYEWELWDADTPEMMEQLKRVYTSLGTKRRCLTS